MLSYAIFRDTELEHATTPKVDESTPSPTTSPSLRRISQKQPEVQAHTSNVSTTLAARKSVVNVDDIPLPIPPDMLDLEDAASKRISKRLSKAKLSRGGGKHPEQETKEIEEWLSATGLYDCTHILSRAGLISTWQVLEEHAHPDTLLDIGMDVSTMFKFFKALRRIPFFVNASFITMLMCRKVTMGCVSYFTYTTVSRCGVFHVGSGRHAYPRSCRYAVLSLMLYLLV